MATHELKSWPQFFEAIRLGLKTHDLRSKKDREFKVGDTLILLEYDPINGVYTGRTVECTVTFITSNEYPCAYSSAVLDRNAVILSISRKN